MSPEEHNELMGGTKVCLMGTKFNDDDIDVLRSALDLKFPLFFKCKHHDHVHITLSWSHGRSSNTYTPVIMHYNLCTGQLSINITYVYCLYYNIYKTS